MYPDPNRVRSHRIAINLNKYEHDVIQSFSNLIGIVDILPALKGRGFLLQDAHVRARECSWRH